MFASSVANTTTKPLQHGGYHIKDRHSEYARILGVESWKMKHQIAAVDLAQRAYKLSFKHEWNKNAVSIGCAELRRLFGQSSRIPHMKNNILIELQEGYSKAKKVTKAYQLQPSIRKAIEQMDRRRIEQHLNGNAGNSVILDSDGKRVKRITAFQKKSARSESLHGIPAWCPVNVDAVRKTANAIGTAIECVDGNGSSQGELADELLSVAEKIGHKNNPNESGQASLEVMREYLARVQNELAEILDLANSANNNGKIPLRYNQSKAGRWYAEGSPTLQNCTRITRTAALHGFYSFDIESCHHAIALQEAKRMGLPCENLEHYVNNKKAVREQIAEDIRAPVSSVKTSLIAMIYGASTSPYGAIAKELTGNKFAEAMKTPVFAGLSSELKLIFKAMLDDTDGAKTGKVKNAMDLTEPYSTRSNHQRRLVAHLFQGIEAQALQAALKIHETTVVPIHDGWICTSLEDNVEAETAIRDATGFDLAVNKGELIQLSGI